MSLQCLRILVSLSAADMPPGTEFQCESNSAQQQWQPQGGEERESRAGWGQFRTITRLRLQIKKNKCIKHRAERVARVARSRRTAVVASKRKSWHLEPSKRSKNIKELFQGKFMPADIQNNINHPGIVKSSTAGGEE